MPLTFVSTKQLLCSPSRACSLFRLKYHNALAYCAYVMRIHRVPIMLDGRYAIYSRKQRLTTAFVKPLFIVKYAYVSSMSRNLRLWDFQQPFCFRTSKWQGRKACRTVRFEAPAVVSPGRFANSDFVQLVARVRPRAGIGQRSHLPKETRRVINALTSLDLLI